MKTNEKPMKTCEKPMKPCEKPMKTDEKHEKPMKNFIFSMIFTIWTKLMLNRINAATERLDILKIKA